MKRAVLRFSLRTEARMPAHEMRVLVERALGCTLVETYRHGTPLLESELLGIDILFTQWRGLERKETFQLHGIPEGATPEENLFVDINQAVIDLLESRGAGKWHVPTLEEIDAEAAYAAEHDREQADGGDESSDQE